ncbi:MAG: alpha-2-macroglobulin [Pseudomonadota bacterium]
MPNKFLTTLQSFLAIIFGKLSWQYPPWLLYLRRKKPSTPVCIAIVILAVVTGLTYSWYKNHPHPQLITAQISVPQITPNNKELVPDVLTLDFGLQTASGFTTQSVAPLKMLGQPVTEGITLTPPAAGKWEWQSDSRLVFSPSQDWPAGQTYTIHFAKNVFSDPAKLQSLDYAFTTLPFAATISELKFYQDPVDAQLRQIIITLKFNYPVDMNSLENSITLMEQSLKQGGLDFGAPHFKFTLTADEHKRLVYVHSEPFPLTNTERYFTLIVAKGVKASSGTAKTNVAVTGKVIVPDLASFFKVNVANASIVRNAKDQPQQVLTVETSVGVSDAQLTKSLHAYLLPQNYPATATEAAKTNYQWLNPGEITPAILALATPLNLNALPADRDYATLHSYQFNAVTPRFIYFKLDKGVKSFGNFVLSNDFAAVIKVPEYPQEIGFLHKGALLALNDQKKLSVLVRGLPAVKFQIARVLPADVNQLLTQTQGDFNNPRFVNPHFNQDNISEIFSEIQNFDNSDAAKAQYSALDLGKYLSAAGNTSGPQGLFLLEARGWDPERKIPLDVKASRLILITDLGLLVKDNSDGSHDVFVDSITQGSPVANVLVSVLGKNGLPILTQTADAQGHVNFPTLKDYTDEREPTVYLAQQGNDVAFIPYGNFDRQLNFSRFDIGGVYNNDQEQQSLSAYVFSDRGIYRPGDTAHIAMIVKQMYAKAQPAGLPLEATVIDPRGMTIKDEKFTLDATGYLTLDFATADTSPTGQYTVNLFIVKDNHPANLLGSTQIRVEEFLPDNMRISAHLSEQHLSGWVAPGNLTATVGLWNLYGAPAADRKISAKILLTPQTVKFSQYPDYTFIDPLLDPQKPPKVFTDTLTDMHTNDQGQAQFDLRLDRFEKATYQLTFYAEGFAAEGGRSVITQTTTLVSPLAYLVGYKPDGDLSYLKQNAQHQINYIAVNPELKTQAVADLKIQLLSLHPVTTLVKKADGTYQYQSLIQSTIVNTTAFAISETGTSYTLPTQQIGDYALVVLDKNNIELSRLKFSVVGASQQPLPKNAELTIKLNKTEFMPDTDIEMQLTAPYTGAGLITIERDKVYAAQWFKADTTSSMQKIHVPKDFEGNGYVNVAFVRDWNSPEIFISPLSDSIVPFMVNHASHNIAISLDTPGVVRPGESFTINYKSDKPGKIIVFAVDEGILQAAGYQTPDPLGFFFQKRALEVSTLQTLDQILPKFIQDRELSAAGGDNGEAAALKTQNPFKRKTDLPVVYWSGIVDTDTTSRSVVYQIPDYFNGALRVMAVAVATDAVGATAKTTEVRGDFVITPNVPTFVAPGDEFEITASIANNLAGSGIDAPVIVTMSTTPALEVIGDTIQNLKISEGKEQTAHFKLRAKALLGSATVTLVANNNSKFSKMATTLSVRPTSAYATQVNSGYAASGKQSLTVDSVLYPEYRTVDAAFSPSPLILIVGLQRYLDNFPYGCTEQLTSKALPLLALANQTWYGQDTNAINAKLQQTFQTLAQRQMSNGGFSYWPSENMNASNQFASVYALHFLTDARVAGFAVPLDMLRSGMDYLKDLATQDVSSLDEARIQAYAIYVLTRNEIVTTNYLTNLLLYLNKDPAHAWQKDITSAYIAATYQLMKSVTEANRLIAYYQPQPKINVSMDFYDQNIADAQYLYLLARHFPERLTKVRDQLVMPLVSALNSGDMNTILSGYASMAFAAYAQTYAVPNGSGYALTATLNNDRQLVLPATNDIYQHVSLDEAVKKVEFSAPKDTGIFYQLTQAGFDKNPPDSVLKKGLEVAREYRDAQGKTVTSVGLGNELEVHIQIRALDNQYLNNIAIVDLLPGGFEVVRDSVKNDQVDYADAREDRVIFFASVGPDAKELVYRIKATNVGKYTVAPILASSMYDPARIARGLGGSMQVTQG